MPLTTPPPPPVPDHFSQPPPLPSSNSIHDWLSGVRVADTTETEQLLQPAKARDGSLDTLTDSERLRIVSELITSMPSEGGAGIYPGQDKFVESILPLHDKAFNMVGKKKRITQQRNLLFCVRRIVTENWILITMTQFFFNIGMHHPVMAQVLVNKVGCGSE